MFELTNAQRACFGLLPVDSGWTRMELKPSPYDSHATIAYLDGTTLRKFVATGENLYREYEICEQLTDDLRYLLPKTAKGKPVFLSAATLSKRTALGMCLSYYSRTDYDLNGYANFDIYSNTSRKCYYSNDYETVCFQGTFDFPKWVENWCSETTQEDLEDVALFSAQPRQHVKFREGDVFRFKINRRLYGYGRILLDYDLMRKKKVPFWDVLMGKPLAASVYHIVTERKDVTVEELAQLNSLPSGHMMDNRLYYGDFEIIGNIPIRETEDYPIMYGDSIHHRDTAVILQCGKLYRRIENGSELFRDFSNRGVGFVLRFDLTVLLECIQHGSNAPYWAQDKWRANDDLRNPKFAAELAQVCEQFGISPSQLIK